MSESKETFLIPYLLFCPDVETVSMLKFSSFSPSLPVFFKVNISFVSRRLLRVVLVVVGNDISWQSPSELPVQVSLPFLTQLLP